MNHNSYSLQSHSPSFPAEEDGEWVSVWVPRTALPSPQVGPHESQLFANSPLSSQFAILPVTPQSPYPSQAWDQSQLVGMNHFYPSPANTSSPLNNTPFSGSPVDQLLDDFDIDAALQDTNVFNVDQSLLGLADHDLFGLPDHNLLGLGNESLMNTPILDQNPVDADLFSAFVDFSGVELDLSIVNGTNSFVPPTTSAGSPTSSTQALDDFNNFTLRSSIPSDATRDPTAYSSVATTQLANPTTYYSPLTTGATPSSVTSSTPVSPSSSQTIFTCSRDYCNHVFGKVSDLRRHERRHRQNFRCDLCGKGHIDQRGLDRHMWAQHKGEAKKRNTRSEEIKCTECDYVGRSDNVARHMKRHSGKKVKSPSK